MNIKNFFKNFLKQDVSYDILESYPDAVIVINFQKNIINWNKKSQEMFGFSTKEALGKNIGFVFADEVEKIYQSLGENRVLILNVRTKMDQEILIEVSCSNAENKEDVIITARDVTKRLKVVDSLKIELDKTAKVNQNKSSFIASLSHELRTPVHSIIGFSQALLDGISGTLSEKQEKYVSIISKNATNLLALLNNILDLSKIEAGKMEFSFKNFDVVQLITSVTEVISHFASDKKLDFSIDSANIVKRNIYSDENMLRQVLLNVLNNAVKFTEIGSVNLNVTHPDLEFVKTRGINPPADFTDKSYLMFSVIDTGIGIAPEDTGSIFDEYRQFDRSASKKFGGTGLGLAITRKILNQLGGIIWIESGATQGSTFNFIIPIERPKTGEEFVI